MLKAKHLSLAYLQKLPEASNEEEEASHASVTCYGSPHQPRMLLKTDFQEPFLRMLFRH